MASDARVLVARHMAMLLTHIAHTELPAYMTIPLNGSHNESNKYLTSNEIDPHACITLQL